MNKKIIGYVCCLCFILASIPVAADPGYPELPTNPCPSEGSTMVIIYPELHWNCGSGDRESGYTYDIFFGIENPPPKIASNISGVYFNPGTLAFETTYYWQVVAWSEGHNFTQGSIWEFTTARNQPPFQPRILNGPHAAGSNILVNFTAISADPEIGQVYYQWDWGDGNISEWLGPYEFGAQSVAAYRWERTGDYDIIVHAKDAQNNESTWSATHHLSIAPQVRIGMLKPGYMYFDILGFNDAYAYIYALDQLDISVYLSTGGFSINATVSENVRKVTFEVKNLFFQFEQTYANDEDMTDGCEVSFELSRGFYQATAYAYDHEGKLIDRHVRDYFLFLEINKKTKAFGGLSQIGRLARS